MKIIDTTHWIGWLVQKIARRKSFKRGFDWFPSQQMTAIVPKKVIDFQSEKFLLDVELLETTLADTFTNWTNELEQLTHKSFANHWSIKQKSQSSEISSDLKEKLAIKLRQSSM